MNTSFPENDLLFDVLTPLGFRVHVSIAYWHFIVTVKHPVMIGKDAEVRKTLEFPEEIRQSRTDANVFLFYSLDRPGRWVCAVARDENGNGFLITAYPTNTIKEGNRLWPM